MKKNLPINVVGVTVTILGVVLSIAQKQIEDKKLQDLIQKEVQKQINNH